MSLAKNFHIQPSEIEMMPAWEYEIFMKELNEAVKEDNNKQEKEMDDPKYRDLKKMSDPSYMSKLQSTANGKLPSMPSIGSGSFSLPKI